MVGDIIRANRKNEISEMNMLLLKSNRINNPIIKRWVERSRNLLANPKTYEYKYWGLSSEYVLQEKMEMNIHHRSRKFEFPNDILDE